MSSDRSGQHSTGSDTVFIDDLAAHRLSDSGSCQCSHGGQFISSEGSEFVFFDDLPATMIGHLTVCQGCGMTGQHVSGSETVDISR